MGYNIDTVTVLSMDLKISKENWVKWKDESESESDYYLPETNFIEELTPADFGRDGYAQLKNFWWGATSSGGTYNETLPELVKDLVGEGEFIFTWEGGDSIMDVHDNMARVLVRKRMALY